ncbi:ABC transporter ATP-binding protein [Lysinibacillus sp. SGAir0095]|uniref:ABC transporter ATP-binding protein n=1 Tax=Lysinibacillus sp. SGAir0095 TaxID=2070463 RepID=UPI0010CD5D73|nr:ABC transporter ATP-binding protein [Lysinibacillus sp. SGAir0095]QCR31274.1 ABC transporter ATP-binding protein [Lysinibacillus sp. SGAir0095]
MLEIRDLSVFIHNKQVLNQVSFSVPRGKIVGIIGESGSGKSVLCSTILNLYRNERIAKGNIEFDGKSLLLLEERKMREMRGKEIALIMQNPMSMFNPIVSIGGHFTETLQAHTKMTKKEAIEKAKEQLALFQLGDVDILNKYPNELSGGMLQRIMIAIAASLEPKLLLADEPTTALDTMTQLEILKELKKLHDKTAMSMLVVSHDLGVIANLAEEIIVMRRGIVVEHGPTSHILLHPVHPYTQTLVAARDEHSKLEELADRYERTVSGELVLYDENHWVRMEETGK